LNLYIEVSDGKADEVDFTFYNKSIISSSIAQIYFDDDSLLDTASITGGFGTLFCQTTTPGNLPAGNSLDPPFVAVDEFSFKSEAPGPQNGINPGEWLQVTFVLEYETIFTDVLTSLNTSALRVGVHVIALPDGSSESAVSIPEPTTICLLGLGALVLLRKCTA